LNLLPSSGSLAGPASSAVTIPWLSRCGRPQKILDY
jgi:hypothetical protein